MCSASRSLDPGRVGGDSDPDGPEGWSPLALGWEKGIVAVSGYMINGRVASCQFDGPLRLFAPRSVIVVNVNVNIDRLGIILRR